MSKEDLICLTFRLKKEVKRLNFLLNKQDLDINHRDERISKLRIQLQQQLQQHLLHSKDNTHFQTISQNEMNSTSYTNFERATESENHNSNINNSNEHEREILSLNQKITYYSDANKQLESVIKK